MSHALHGDGYWRPGCPGCREERSAVLASVQSCTLHAPDQREHVSDRAADMLLDLVLLDRELRGA